MEGVNGDDELKRYATCDIPTISPVSSTGLAPSARQDDTGRAGTAPGGHPRPSLPSGTKDVSFMYSHDGTGENG